MSELTTSTTGQIPADQLTSSVKEPSNQDLNAVQGFAKFMDDGGVFMWIILGMWAFGVAIAAERLKSLFKYDVDGNEIENCGFDRNNKLIVRFTNNLVNENGRMRQEHTYKFDEKQNLIEQSFIDIEDNTLYTSIYQEHDDNGNWLKCIEFYRLLECD